MRKSCGRGESDLQRGGVREERRDLQEMDRRRDLQKTDQEEAEKYEILEGEALKIGFWREI
jgi:hypothetical protein